MNKSDEAVKLATQELTTITEETKPNFYRRNSGRILPVYFFNHKTKTFLKNKRKGL